MIPNRVLGFLFLLAFVAGQAEPYLGAARDGDVHHEDALAALSHSADGGDHGHEDAGSRQHEHDGEHQHGTGGDHCTHVHSGVALQQSFALDLPATVESRDSSDLMMQTMSASYPPIRPPIA